MSNGKSEWGERLWRALIVWREADDDEAVTLSHNEVKALVDHLRALLADKEAA